ncbi:MAG TPA: cytochrome c3 family protein [Geopsychrobacteraceae bacterium]|jgi:predicted CXXCH cytochrome family protein
MADKALSLAILVAMAALLLAGCDPVARHKFTTALLDGYPSLPSADQYFAYYTEQLALQQADAETAAETAVEEDGTSRSAHRPYEEKSCNDCHDKRKTIGLIVEKNRLCGVCHEDFVQGSVVHGPVAIGACLACHLPHSSRYPVLLKASVNDICGNCHTEKRLAEQLHETVRSRGMICVDCHDPHFSNSRYLL